MMEQTGPRVAHLTTGHKPFDIRIFQKECRSLAEAGYDVVLVAVHDQDTDCGGVKLRHLSPTKTRFERMLKMPWRAFRVALRQRAVLYHLHETELLPVGLLLRLLGKRVVYDVHEDLPKAILHKEYIAPWLRRVVALLVAMLEGVCARVFTGIVAATPSIARRFPGPNSVVVQNFPLAGELSPPVATSYADRPCNVVYAGGIHPQRSLYEMIEAAGIVNAVHGVRLKLAGPFSGSDARVKAETMDGWAAVDYLGWQSRDELATVLSQSRAGLVLFHPLPNNIESQPNKLFEYMSAGLPVIASDFPLWRQLIGGLGCGLLVDPRDAKQIADAIAWIVMNPEEAEAMGLRGYEAVMTQCNWDVEKHGLLRKYAEWAGPVSR